MTATTFLTQRQLMSKNMPADAMSGPYAQQQKMLLYVLPVVFAVGGIAFPIGVLIYWTTSNLWTMGQQFYVIRNNPAPGTPAFKAKEDRDRRRHPERFAEEAGGAVVKGPSRRPRPRGPPRDSSPRSSRGSSARRRSPASRRLVPTKQPAAELGLAAVWPAVLRPRRRPFAGPFPGPFHAGAAP